MGVRNWFKKTQWISFYLVTICCVGVLTMPQTVMAATNVEYDYMVTDAVDVVNPKDKVSDAKGVQSMLNKAIGSEEIITIYFPAGTYYIDAPLLIYSNTHLILHKDAVIYRMDSMIDKMLLHNVDQTGVMSKVGGYEMSKNITIEGGTWHGGNTKLATDGKDVVRFDHAENITIKNCTIKNTYDCHIVEFVGVKNGTISGCTLTGFRYCKGKEKNYTYAREAIQLDSAWTNNEKNLSDVDAHWANSTYIDGTSCKNITISNNTFLNVPCGVGQHHYSPTGKARNEDITISNNVFKFTKAMNACKTAITCCGTDNLTVSNNTVEGYYRFAAHVIASKDVTIEKNHFQDIKVNGIMIDAGDTIAIKQNTIKGSQKHGISVGGGTVTEISDNKVIGAKDIGISVDAGTVNLIANNTIKSPKKHGICISTKSTNGKGPVVQDVTGNSIASSKQNGITIGAGTITNITNNTITSVAKHGISLSGSSSGKQGAVITNVSGNVITSPKKNGISVDAGKITNINSNKIKSAGQHGISIVGTAKTKNKITITNVKKNSITAPKSNGISANSGKISMISQNTIKNSKRHGISIIGVTVVGNGKKKTKGILQNTITTCKNNGILVSGNAAVSAVSRNKVTSAGNVGIALTGKAKVQWVIKNTVKKCKKRGIQNITPTNTKIQNNKGQLD